MQPFVSTVNHTGIVVEKKLPSGSKWATLSMSQGSRCLQWSTQKCSALGTYSASLCKTFFPQRRQSKSAHSNRTHSWLDGRRASTLHCSQGLLQFPVCLAVVSCFLFSSCEPSCVWAILEERIAEQLVARDTKCGNECCYYYSSNIQEKYTSGFFKKISNRI